MHGALAGLGCKQGEAAVSQTQHKHSPPAKEIMNRNGARRILYDKVLQGADGQELGVENKRQSPAEPQGDKAAAAPEDAVGRRTQQSPAQDQQLK